MGHSVIMFFLDAAPDPQLHVTHWAIALSRGLPDGSVAVRRGGDAPPKMLKGEPLG
jgi:hypothetical protein